MALYSSIASCLPSDADKDILTAERSGSAEEGQQRCQGTGSAFRSGTSSVSLSLLYIPTWAWSGFLLDIWDCLANTYIPWGNFALL